MRLCFIANLSIHTQRLLRYFVDRGHEVYLISVPGPQVPVPPEVTVYHLPSRAGVCPAATDPDSSHARQQGDDTLQTQGSGKLRWLLWARRVRTIVRALRPDVLHAHQISPCGWLGAAAGYHPFVATAWGSDLLVGAQRSRTQKLLALWVIRTADYVTCVSQDLAAAALALRAKPQRLSVAPWGVDVGIYHPASCELRGISGPTSPDHGFAERSGAGTAQPRPSGIVLSPRSVKAVYRPLDIARAIPGVLERAPGAHFVIRTHNSDPVLLERFKAEVQASGVIESVEFIGELPNERAIADLYRRADVVVSVPSSDGTPSSVLEALACGAVPVVSDVASLHEWVEHEREALFVPVGDAPAISSAIVRLLCNEALRTQMAALGAQMIRERADSRVLMQRNEELYEELIR